MSYNTNKNTIEIFVLVIPLEQLFPVYPGLQIHSGFPFLYKHNPPFWHGFESQASIVWMRKKWLFPTWVDMLSNYTLHMHVFENHFSFLLTWNILDDFNKITPRFSSFPVKNRNSWNNIIPNNLQHYICKILLIFQKELPRF